MKDWEYWKKQYLEDDLQSALAWFQRIEMQTKSPIESIVCLYLREYANNNFAPLELQVTPQCEIGPYTVDFLLTHESTNTCIVVECDGHEFHEKTKQQAAHDKRRDRYLTKLGYIMLRYTGSQICEDPHEIVDDVSEILIAASEKQSGLI